MYYDVFDYPLNFDELFAHLGKGFNKETFIVIVNELVDEKLLVIVSDYYLSPLSNADNIKKRREGNEYALAMMPTAIKWAKRIYHFPFVRSVNLSGSLSKNYFDNNSDIDFFIITKANRLWICRTLLILYWKISSAENKKKFCTNYFVDETVLEMEEKNRFTATELSYLVPIINFDATKKILDNNLWIKNYINNKTISHTYATSVSANILKKIGETCLKTKLGDYIEYFLLKKTIIRWRKKYPELADEDFELQFRSRKNVCKRHTKGFQNKVLQRLDEKIAQFEKHYGFNLK